MLALPPPADDAPHEPKCYASPQKPTAKQKAVWHLDDKPLIQQLTEQYDDDDDDDDENNQDENEISQADAALIQTTKRSRYWSKDVEDKLGLTGVDPYGLLELETRRYLATPDEIRKAYRRLILTMHPDKKAAAAGANGGALSPVTAVAKARAEKREEKREADAKDNKKKKGKDVSNAEAEDEGEEDAEDTEFKLLSAAWELLGNAESRRSFDSIDYFNDYLPSSYKRARPDDPPTRFFDTFGPPFARQSKFSTTQPTPPLGDADTPYEEVAKFYRFWQTSYKSWRDFSLLSEHKIGEATSREEKRWMQRQNQNQADRVKKDESKRVSAFIALAQEHDPRVLKYREEVAAKKAAAKEAKEAAVRAEQEAKEAELRAKAEADAAVEAAAAKEKAAKDDIKAAAKREKEKLRSALKKARKDLKALGELPRWVSRVGDLEAAASALAIEEIEALKTAMTSGDDAVADAALAAALKKAMG